ncbi:MAG: flagellar hook-basal body complex protein FliE [Oscillospiraceae bacterium]
MGNFISAIQPIQKMAFSKIEEAENSTESSAPFVNILKDAISEYTSKQEAADAEKTALALGESDDLTRIQIDSLEAETELQTTFQLNSRVVKA